MPEKTFITSFFNLTKTAIAVTETNGAVLGSVAPKETVIVESVSPLTTFARWSSVEFSDKDGVTLKARAGWEEPDRGGPVTRFLNKEGHLVEQRPTAIGMLFLMKGIPVMVVLPEGDPLRGASVTIKRVPERTPVLGWDGYISTALVLRDVVEDAAERQPDVQGEGK
jgi:hypothetical protein